MPSKKKISTLLLLDCNQVINKLFCFSYKSFPGNLLLQPLSSDSCPNRSVTAETRNQKPKTPLLLRKRRPVLRMWFSVRKFVEMKIENCEDKNRFWLRCA